MHDLDPARVEIVNATACLEDAVTAALPGQAPQSTAHEILHAIDAALQHITASLNHPDRAKTITNNE
ncbi:MAG: hypothetical protein AAF583_14145 [Pseudomonadota bacterium]